MYRVIVDAVLSFYLLNKLKLRVNYFRNLLLYSLIVLYSGKRHFKLVRTLYE